MNEYKVYGYIQYLREYDGFVTPIFERGDKKYVQQEHEGELDKWLELEITRDCIIHRYAWDKPIDTSKIIYAFKWKNEIVFGDEITLINWFFAFSMRSKENLELYVSEQGPFATANDFVRSCILRDPLLILKCQEIK